MAAFVDTKRLISDVQQRPALWNRNYAINKAFTEDTWDELSEMHALPKTVLKTRWKSLRDNFRIEFKRIPRDKEGNCMIPPELHKSKWAYYRNLLFLVDHMKTRYPPNETYTPDDKKHLYSFEDSSYSCDFEEEDNETQYIQIPEGLPKMMSISPSTDINNTMIQDINHAGTIPLPPLVPVSMPKITYPNKRLRTEEDTTRTSNGSPALNREDMDDDYHFLMSLHSYMGQMSNGQKLKIRMKIQNIIYKELYKDDDENENGTSN